MYVLRSTGTLPREKAQAQAQARVPIGLRREILVWIRIYLPFIAIYASSYHLVRLTGPVTMLYIPTSSLGTTKDRITKLFATVSFDACLELEM